MALRFPVHLILPSSASKSICFSRRTNSCNARCTKARRVIMPVIFIPCWTKRSSSTMFVRLTIYTSYPKGMCMQSKFNRLVQPAALGATGAVHVRIIGINVPAIFAAKNPVFTVGRPKTAPAHLGKHPKPDQSSQSERHIDGDERLNVHGEAAGELVAGTGKVSQSKIIRPRVGRAAGKKCVPRAS